MQAQSRMTTAIRGNGRGPASRKREMLALYLDFLFYAALFSPLEWIVTSGGAPLPYFWRIAIFVPIRLALMIVFNGTPGRWALGIERSGDTSVVDPEIKGREGWWTILAGVLLVLEGSKNLVRWTQGLPPPPILGAVPISDSVSFAAISLVGATNVIAGLLVLRTHWSGAALGATVWGIELFCMVAGREAFSEWVAKEVMLRRQIQGMRVRDGEIEFILASFPTVMWSGALVGALILVAVGYRFYSRDAAT